MSPSRAMNLKVNAKQKAGRAKEECWPSPLGSREVTADKVQVSWQQSQRVRSQAEQAESRDLEDSKASVYGGGHLVAWSGLKVMDQNRQVSGTAVGVWGTVNIQQNRSGFSGK